MVFLPAFYFNLSSTLIFSAKKSLRKTINLICAVYILQLYTLQFLQYTFFFLSDGSFFFLHTVLQAIQVEPIQYLNLWQSISKLKLNLFLTLSRTIVKYCSGYIGQLISKRLFGVIVWTKNPPNFLKDFCPSL